MTTLARAALLCAAAMISAGVRAQTPGTGFQVLDLLEGTTLPEAYGYGVDETGTIVVGVAACGQFCGRAVRWNALGQIEILQGPSAFVASASSVTPDALLVTGTATLPGRLGRFPVTWSGLSYAMETLPGIGETFDGILGTVSDDRRVIAGLLSFPGGSSAVRWIDRVPEDLRRLPGDTAARSVGVSGNGRAFAGTGANLRAIRIFEERVEDLGDLPGVSGGLEQGGGGISFDGRRVAGAANSARYPLNEAFLWSSRTGMIPLGVLPNMQIRLSYASAMSSDGRVVGGSSGTDFLYEYYAFLWDAVHGMRDVNQIVDELGVDREGWVIDGLHDLNSDGTGMVGMARRGEERRAYLLRLPPWCHADCDGSGDIDFNDFLCFLNRYNRAQADPRGNPIDFVYCDFALDDTIDFADVLEYLRLYSAGCGG
jgi:uncharacterized membrane protein